MAKELKDWSKSIDGLADMGADDVIALYSEMLASAHDLGYKVPDAQLIETEDAEKLRGVIPALHTGLVKYNAEAQAEAKTKKAAAEKKPAKAVSKKAVTKPAKEAAQKPPAKEKEPKMAKTAKKAAKAAAPAKKAAKAPAKKAAKGAKKASANARTGVARNPFGENAVIKVLNKETGVRADSERGKRIAAVFKYANKKVSAFYEGEKPPYNRTDTLRFLVDRKFISVK
jgi:outer membrane biosynthesis protein TonB